MHNVVSTIVLAAALVLGTVIPGTAAPQPRWTDATHHFEKDVEKLVGKVKREAKKDHAARTRTTPPSVRIYKVGDVERFWTKNFVEDKFVQINAVLRAIGTHCYVFVQEGKDVAAESVTKVQKSFDENIYPTNTSHFGFEWKPGVDGDEHITLLMLDIQEGYNPEDENGQFVGGYFFGGDEYLQSEIPEEVNVKSNEREMFYLDIFPGDPTKERYMSVVAHEFQHMIHFNQDPKEFTWLNEACSQTAGYLCGFGHAGQITSFMQTPDNSITAWADEQMLANYGQVYLWNHFLISRFLTTEEKRKTFFQSLVSDQAKGIEGYENALKPFGSDFRTAFEEFCVANYINDASLDKGQYAYEESLKRFRLPAPSVATFPVHIKDTVYLWSADAIKIDLDKVQASRLALEFGGVKAAFTDDTFNTFKVNLVLCNSRNRAKPTIQSLDIAASADNKLQLGKTEISLKKEYDTLLIIVSNEAPAGIPDKAYSKAPGLPYAIIIRESGIIVPAGGIIINANVDSIANNYRTAAASLAHGENIVSNLAYAAMAGAANDLSTVVEQELANGRTEAIDALISLTQSADAGQREALRALTRTMATKVSFQIEHHGDRDRLGARLEALTKF